MLLLNSLIHWYTILIYFEIISEIIATKFQYNGNAQISVFYLFTKREVKYNYISQTHRRYGWSKKITYG